MKENRDQPRFGPLIIKAFVREGGRRREGYLTNISTTGALLAMDSPPARGEELELSASLPWRLGELRVHARVVWRRGERDDVTPIAGAGLEFVELSEESAGRLDAYLQRFVELAESLEP